MTLATRKRKTWLCMKCGHKNPHRTSSRTCDNCGEQGKRKRPQRKHSETLRVDSYETYAILSVEIHGGEDHACGVCGKPPTENRKNDRDHCHRTGRPRGLACPGNNGCNVLMAPWITAEAARTIAAEQRRLGYEREAVRWEQIGAYLERVDAYYREREE